MSGDESEIEEERRLCYVGITRAKERLFLSSAKRRMLRGQTQYNRHSRFIDEIPSAYLDIKKNNSTHQEVKKTDRPVKYQYGAGAGKPYNLSDFKIKPAGELNYQVGDRVKHIKFGVGTVLYALTIGPLIQLCLPWFHQPAARKALAKPGEAIS